MVAIDEAAVGAGGGGSEARGAVGARRGGSESAVG